MEDKISTVPIHLKMALTAREAAEYSNIGINKIDSMLRSPTAPSFCLSAQRNWSSERSLNSLSVKNW